MLDLSSGFTRIPRYVRVANYPPIAIGRPEDRILRAIAQFHYVTAKQLARLLYRPSSLTYVQDALKDLFQAGYLRRLFLPTTTLHGSPAAIYALDQKGVAYLRTRDRAPQGRFRPSEESHREAAFLEHTLAANDFLIATALLAQTEPGIALAQLIAERELRRNFQVFVRGTKGRIYVVNDGWVDLRMAGGRQMCLALELDRGTIERERFKQKVGALVEYARQGYQETFGTQSLTVLFVTTAGERRLRAITDWLEEELSGRGLLGDTDLFRLAAFNPAAVSAEEIYFSRIWHRPFAPESLPLITRR